MTDNRVRPWWNVCAPGKSLDWWEIDTDHNPTLCLNASIVGAKRCDVLLLRDKPNRYVLSAIEGMMRLRPVLCVYQNERSIGLWNDYIDKDMKSYKELPSIPRNKQPVARQAISWTGLISGRGEEFKWMGKEVGVNPKKGIFTAILYAAQHTKCIKLYGVDMAGKGYHDDTVEVRAQKWEKRWDEEKITMAKMYTAMTKRGWLISGLPQDFLVEFDLC